MPFVVKQAKTSKFQNPKVRDEEIQQAQPIFGSLDREPEIKQEEIKQEEKHEEIKIERTNAFVLQPQGQNQEALVRKAQEEGKSPHEIQEILRNAKLKAHFYFKGRATGDILPYNLGKVEHFSGSMSYLGNGDSVYTSVYVIRNSKE